MKYIIISLFLIPHFVFGATLYENYATHNDSGSVYGVYWYGQVFLTTSEHTLTSIKLPLYRTGSIGIANVRIRAVSAGLPTGSDLGVASTDVSALTTSSSGSLVEFTFSPAINLSNTTSYVAILNITGDSSNKLNWMMDYPTGSYSGGTGISSSDSGVNFTAQTYDYDFEIYGNAITQEESTSTATSTATLNDIEFGLGIIIVLMFLYFIGYIYNHLSKKSI